MNVFLKFLHWFFAIVLIINGIGHVTTPGMLGSSLISILCGCIILPPVINEIRKYRPVNGIVFFLTGLVGFIVIGLTMPDSERVKPKTLAQTLADSLDKVKSDSIQAISDAERKIQNDIDVAYLKADRALKEILKDPDSYERIDYRSWKSDKKKVHVSCWVKYRAKNSFGGYNVESAIVEFNESMDPINIIPNAM